MSSDKIIIIYGPPGSGKGTQANLLARKLGLVHVDTGRMLETVFENKGSDPFLAEQEKLYNSGKLVDSELVFKLISDTVNRLHAAKSGIIFSGSPRALEEAKKLLPLIADLYGKQNILAFALEVPESVSLERNKNRWICSFCEAPLLTQYVGELKVCPACGGELVKRKDDNPETIVVRLKEYHDRTEPILKYMEDEGYFLRRIHGEEAPYKVFTEINGYLKNA